MSGDDRDRGTAGGEEAADPQARADPPVTVRRARPADRVGVRRVLDGAALAVPTDAVPEAVAAGDCLVAVPEPADRDAIVGALLLDRDEIVALAVRRRRRDRGIGTALVAAAARDRNRLVATFDPDVRPFYERLGFRIEAVADDERCRGILEGSPDGFTDRSGSGPG